MPDPRERLAESIADDEGREPATDRPVPVAENDAAMALIARVAAGFRATTAIPAASAAPERWGTLRVRRPLGEGSFGDVYAAWDPALQREVALKLRRAGPSGAAGSTTRWLEEGRRLARVRHPNVLTVHGADEHDGRAGIWTDLVEGRSLEDHLAINGPLSAREAALVGAELCAALAAVHGAGLVHGDVKTRNVLRAAGDAHGGGAGRVVLVDFGAASDAAGSEAPVSHGTPLSMSPERLAGGPPSAAADLWALGVLLFRLTTGRHPWEASSLAELREKSARGERTRLLDARADLPRAFVAVVERSLAQAPADRFASAADFEAALSAFLSGASLRRSRGPVPWLAAAALLGIAAAAWWWVLRPAADSGREVAATSAAPAAGTPAPAASPLRVAERATPIVPPSPTPAPPRVEAALLRWRDGEAQPLVNGGRIQPGDRLSLEITTTEPLHVYVLDEDGHGEVTTLFPFGGGGVSNPIERGRRHELPGTRAGEALRWLVTSAEGRETFLIVATRRPLAPIERAVAALPRVREGEDVRYATLAPTDLRRMRGVASVVADSGAPPSAAGHLAEMARALEAGAASEELWLRLVRVDNPAR